MDLVMDSLIRILLLNMFTRNAFLTKNWRKTRLWSKILVKNITFGEPKNITFGWAASSLLEEAAKKFFFSFFCKNWAASSHLEEAAKIFFIFCFKNWAASSLLEEAAKKTFFLFFCKNWAASSHLEEAAKIFFQKSKFSSKIEISVTNRNLSKKKVFKWKNFFFHCKFFFTIKISIFDELFFIFYFTNFRDHQFEQVRQKSKFSSKIEIFVKNRNFSVIFIVNFFYNQNFDFWRTFFYFLLY